MFTTNMQASQPKVTNITETKLIDLANYAGIFSLSTGKFQQARYGTDSFPTSYQRTKFAHINLFCTKDDVL